METPTEQTTSAVNDSCAKLDAWETEVDQIVSALAHQPSDAGDTAIYVAGQPGRFVWLLQQWADQSMRLLPAVVRAPKLRRRKKTASAKDSAAAPTPPRQRVRRLRSSELRGRPNAFSDPVDREIFVLVEMAEATRYVAGASHRAAIVRMFLLLAGRDNVLDSQTLQPVSVVRREVTLRVRRSSVGTHFEALAGDRKLEDREVQQLAYRVNEGEARLYTELSRGPAPATLWLLKVSDTVLAGMRHIARRGSRLHRDAGVKLARSLVPLATRAELKIAKSLRGSRCSGSSALFIHLSWNDGLSVKVLVRPLEGGAATTPGEGDAVWYGNAGDQLTWCERDLEVESARAGLLWDGLFGETKPANGTFGRLERDRDTALDLVARLRGLTERNDDLRIIWDTDEVKVVPMEIDQMRVQLGNGQAYFASTVTIGEGQAVIPLGQALAAIKQKQKYVQLQDGSWRRLSGRLCKRLSYLPESNGDQFLLAAPVIEEWEKAGIDIVGSDHWRKVRDEINRSRTWSPKQPAALKAKLRPYQLSGLTWMRRLARWAPGCVLADEMGLGKTVQTIGLLAARAAAGPALVVAPTSVVFNWEAEIARFSPSLRVHVVRSHGSLEQLDVLGPKDVVLTTWTSLCVHATRFKGLHWHTLVLDEAQAIKNYRTRRACTVLQLTRDFTVALTGTPMENRTIELWSLMRAVVPGLLGNKEDFFRTFIQPIEARGCNKALRHLGSQITPFVLRRLKAEVATELPEKRESVVEIQLCPSTRRRYEGLREASRQVLAGKDLKAKQQLLAALTRLRQLACDRRLVDPDFTAPGAKIEALRVIVRELAETGQQVLVFSQFTSLLDLARHSLEGEGHRCGQIDGRTPAKSRKSVIRQFEDGEVQVLLLSLRAAGVGLNLVAANAVMHLDPWWNPAVEDQATDRAHRIGQRHPVTVYRFVAKQTIEEAIYRLHREKRDLISGVLHGTDVGRAVSYADLVRLFDADQWTPASRVA